MSSLMKAAAGVCLAALLTALGAAGAEATPAPTGNQKPVQIVFVLDTTGSMARLIEGAKRKIWSIATTILDENPDAEVQMGLVAYRDIGDEYVTKTFPLTKDIQGLYADLLSLQARGGGDWPESVNEALYLAVAKTNWDNRPFVDRIVFLVGDAPPHMDYEQDRKYQESLEIARKSGIIVNAVQAGGARDTERVWRSIAQLGHGRYLPIPQDGGKVVLIETPYDREIIELQIEINRTIVPYGSPEQQGGIRMKAEVSGGAPAPVSSEMAKYVNRAGKGKDAVTGEGDLVADIANGRKELSGVKEAELPAELRRLPPEGRAAAIEERSKRRTELAARMDTLVKQRDAYVAKQGAASKPAELVRRRREGDAARPDEEVRRDEGSPRLSTLFDRGSKRKKRSAIHLSPLAGRGPPKAASLRSRRG